jgi:RNA polymerase sigma-70 factor, ECF subfamily
LSYIADSLTPRNEAYNLLVRLTRGVWTIPIDLETVTEARLVAGALAGQQSAFEQIVRRYQRPMVRFIARVTGDREHAEDLAQESFVKAFRSLAAFDTSRRLSSWLFRIAHNTAIDAMRRPRRRLVSIDAGTGTAHHAVATPAAPPEPDPVERAALGQALEAAMRRLRPEFRAAVVLRYDEGLPFDEIGQVMGIPEATARSHVHRARKELVRHLTEAGWQP